MPIKNNMAASTEVLVPQSLQTYQLHRRVKGEVKIVLTRHLTHDHGLRIGMLARPDSVWVANVVLGLSSSEGFGHVQQRITALNLPGLVFLHEGCSIGTHERVDKRKARVRAVILLESLRTYRLDLHPLHIYSHTYICAG